VAIDAGAEQSVIGVCEAIGSPDDCVAPNCKWE
jgi:hypothetical protein